MRKPPKNQSSNPGNDYQVEENHEYRTVPPAGAVAPVVPNVNVLAYRGQEYHGVNPDLGGPPADLNADVFDQSMVIAPQADKDQPDIRPVPVHVVNLSSREIRSFRTDQIPVSTTPMMLVGRDPNRTSLMVKNTDQANSIYISDNANANAVTGYPVGPGVEVSLGTSEAIYAVASTAPVNVAVLAEMSIKQ